MLYQASPNIPSLTANTRLWVILGFSTHLTEVCFVLIVSSSKLLSCTFLDSKDLKTCGNELRCAIGFVKVRKKINVVNPIQTREGGGGIMCPPPLPPSRHVHFLKNNISRSPWAPDRKLSDNSTLCEGTAMSTNLRKYNPTRASFIRKKEHFYLLQPYLVGKFLSRWSRKTNLKFMAHWKAGQKSYQREVIRKNACIAPKPQSVLLPALHLKFWRSLTNFQASIPSKAGFYQLERLMSRLRYRLDRSWNRALANHSLPARQTKRQDKNCIWLHWRARGWREAQLQRAKTTIFSPDRRSVQSVNRIACLSAACTWKMATLR